MEAIAVSLALGVLLGAGAVVLFDEHVYERGVRDGRTERDAYAFEVGWQQGVRRGMRIGVQSVVADLLGVCPANGRSRPE